MSESITSTTIALLASRKASQVCVHTRLVIGVASRGCGGTPGQLKVVQVDYGKTMPEYLKPDGPATDLTTKGVNTEKASLHGDSLVSHPADQILENQDGRASKSRWSGRFSSVSNGTNASSHRLFGSLLIFVAKIDQCRRCPEDMTMRNIDKILFFCAIYIVSGPQSCRLFKVRSWAAGKRIVW